MVQTVERRRRAGGGRCVRTRRGRESSCVTRERRYRVDESLLADGQARILSGSNWPAAPLDPRDVIEEAVSGPGELRDAIDAYTSHAAYASYDEHRKGTLARGMLADIVILSNDIFDSTSGCASRDRRDRHDLRRQDRVPAAASCQLQRLICAAAPRPTETLMATKITYATLGGDSLEDLHRELDAAIAAAPQTFGREHLLYINGKHRQGRRAVRRSQPDRHRHRPGHLPEGHSRAREVRRGRRARGVSGVGGAAVAGAAVVRSADCRGDSRPPIPTSRR